jgi:integrase
VYLKHGSYYYVKSNKWQRLGSDLHTALKAYASIVALPADGVPALIDKAMPHVTAKVADSTRKQYEYCAGLLKEVFAEYTPEQVTHGAIVQMQDMWADSPVTANRLLTVLKLVYQWALDREIVGRNPCASVKRLDQPKRDRLISAAEYKRIYAKAPQWLQVVMDICYLTGQRIGDVLKIEHAHLTDAGIFFEQQKTGKRLTVAWTSGLQDAVERAKRTKGVIKSARYLLAGRAGSMRKHSNVWRTFKNAAREAGVPDVTLHDLRAMSGTEANREGKDPTALLGHTDRRTTQIYLRDKAPPLVDGPSKKAG